jgi:hypothetical protein
MKVVCRPVSIDPYSYDKDKVYDCEIILYDGKLVYQVLNPEWHKMMSALCNGANYGYCDKFPKEYFDKYFIDIKEQRKIKLERINATNI